MSGIRLEKWSELTAAANLLSVPVGTQPASTATPFNYSLLKELLKSPFSEFKWPSNQCPLEDLELLGLQ